MLDCFDSVQLSPLAPHAAGSDVVITPNICGPHPGYRLLSDLVLWNLLMFLSLEFTRQVQVRTFFLSKTVSTPKQIVNIFQSALGKALVIIQDILNKYCASKFPFMF